MPGASGIRAGRAYVELGTDDKLTKGLKKAQKRLKKFADEVGRLGQNMVKASAAMLAPLVLVGKEFAKFQWAMARTRALTGALGKDFSALEREARRLGKSTIFSSTAVAQSMSVYALAGFEVTEILKSMEATTNLAASGMIGMAQAADIAVGSLRGMNIPAEKTGHFVDVMAAAMTTAKTDMIQLGDALRYIGPLAVTAGVEFEEVIAAIQLLSNANVNAEMAGTQLRQMLLSLSSPSKEAADVMSSLGVSIADASGNFKSIAGIIDSLNDALRGKGTIERMEKLGKIFQTRTMSGLSVLMRTGGGTIREWTEALKAAGGTAQRIAAIQIDTLKGEVIILDSAIRDLAIALGKQFVKPLREFVRWSIKAANSVSDWVEQNGKFLVSAIRLALKIGGVGLALTALGIGAKVVGFAMGTLIGILGLLKFALVLVKKAVVGYAFALYGPHNFALGARLNKMLKSIRRAFILLKIAAIATGRALKSMWVWIMIEPTPVVFALLLIAAAVYVAVKAYEEMKGHVAELTDEMKKFRAEAEKKLAVDEGQAARLQQLIGKNERNNREMKEAFAILKDLEDRYGKFGVTFDFLTKSIDVQADSFERLAAAVRKVRMDALEKTIKETKENIGELSNQISDTYGGLSTGSEGWNIGDWDDQEKARNDLLRRRIELYEELEALVEEQGALAAGVPSRGSRGKGAIGPAQAEKVFELQKEWAQKLHVLKLKNIEDEYARERALIHDKYKLEFDELKLAGANRETLVLAEQAMYEELWTLRMKRDKQQAQEMEGLQIRLQGKKLALIKDEFQRQNAMIDLRYSSEIDAARRSHDLKKEFMLEEMRILELTAAKQRHLDQLKDAKDRVAMQRFDKMATIAELEAQLSREGLDLEKELLRLAFLRESRGVVGKDLDLLKEEFKLRSKLLQKTESLKTTMKVSVAGTFNPFAAVRLGGQDPLKEISRNTASIIRPIQRMARSIAGPGAGATFTPSSFP